MTARKYICPSCGQRTGVNIAYGLPSEEMFEMAERGEIALGGCCIDLDGAERRCANCEHEWRIKRKEVRFE